MQLDLKEFIASLPETELTEKILIPLLHELHPGRVEYTHSPIEAGRDIVSYGTDSLGREHILVIQAKATKISYGATSFGVLASTIRVAKEQGVTLSSGYKRKPHEVWYVSSQSFPEQERRQVSDLIENLERDNIKIISGEELSSIVIKHLPKLADQLRGSSDSELSETINRLLENPEAKAFGLLSSRRLDQFYVVTTLAPRSKMGYFAINNRLDISDGTACLTAPITRLLPKKYQRKQNNGRIQLLRDFPHTLKAIKRNSIILLSSKSNLKDYNICIIAEPSLAESMVDRGFDSKLEITINFSINLKHALSNLISNVKRDTKACPKSLGPNPTPFIRAATSLYELDRFVDNSYIEFDARALIKEGAEWEDYIEGDFVSGEVRRIKLDTPINLLKLAKIVLIEGPPGSGKTTIMKVLALRLLENGIPVLLVPCHLIRSKHKRSSLREIARELAVTNSKKKVKTNKTVLLLDGLDECTINLSNKLKNASRQFKSVVCSARSAFLNKIQAEYYCVSLALFTQEERNSFLVNWLTSQTEVLDLAKDIIMNHKDIDYHTRLPLVGTIFVALMENGFNPQTRAEIYSKRLELLLTRWDKAKGVSRLRVNDPQVKTRFLMQLAYKMHSDRLRRRSVSGRFLHDVYEEALGRKGYAFSESDLIDDLINANGVLIQTANDEYSLGHLTFQEHLAGEYLTVYSGIKEIGNLLGDDWWSEPLNFYASRKGCLDDLISLLLESELIYAHASQLKEMLLYAPYTSPGAHDCLMEAARQQRVETEKEDKESFLEGEEI